MSWLKRLFGRKPTEATTELPGVAQHMHGGAMVLIRKSFVELYLSEAQAAGLPSIPQEEAILNVACQIAGYSKQKFNAYCEDRSKTKIEEMANGRDALGKGSQPGFAEPCYLVFFAPV